MQRRATKEWVHDLIWSQLNDASCYGSKWLSTRSQARLDVIGEDIQRLLQLSSKKKG
jgi:hypothetical protein